MGVKVDALTACVFYMWFIEYTYKPFCAIPHSYPESTDYIRVVAKNKEEARHLAFRSIRQKQRGEIHFVNMERESFINTL